MKKNCPYCKSPSRFYSMTSCGPYRHCSSCGLIYREEQEFQDKMIAYYRDEYFSQYCSDQLSGTRNNLYDHVLGLIEKEKGIGRLLDVGTGCGDFLATAQKRGWEVEGIEPSIQSVEMARSRSALKVFQGTLSAYNPDTGFDAITFINVLDHLQFPWQAVVRARDLLRPNGLVYLRFPNGYLHLSLYGLATKLRIAGFANRYLVFHPYCFNPRFIRSMMADLGYEKTLVLNSLPSEGDPHKLFSNETVAHCVKRAIHSTANRIKALSRKRIMLGTSLEVLSFKRPTRES